MANEICIESKRTDGTSAAHEKKPSIARMSGRTIAVVLFAFSVAIGGLNGIFASYISLASHEVVFVRALLVAGVLGTLLAAKRTPLAVVSHKREGLCVLAAGVGMAVQWLFLYEAYELAGVGTATVLLYCAPVIVMAVSPFLFREPMTAAKVVGFCVVVAGALLVNGTAMQGGASPQGIVYGLAAALGFAAMIVFNKLAPHVSGLEKAVMEMGVVVVASGVYSFAFKGATLTPVLSDALPLVLLTVNSALGFYLYFKSMNDLSVQTIAVLGYLEPLCAVLLGAILLGEAMTVLQATGAAFIVAGAILCELRIPTPLCTAHTAPTARIRRHRDRPDPA